MLYCPKCGAQMNGDFCPSCQTRNRHQSSYNYSRPCNQAAYSTCIPNKTPIEVIQKVRRYETISNILWLMIGIVQCLLGFLQPSIWLAGVWNVGNAIIGLVSIKNIQPHNPKIVEKYRKGLTDILIFLGINLVFGGVVGVALCGYDFYIRQYVLKNQYAFY